MASQLHFTSRRSPVLCTHGVVATSQPLASEAGLRILKAGGNAADAAVAAVAALNVTEACMCGLGGDAFCLYYDAATKTVRGLNGSGRAPQALTAERARAVAGDGANRLPADSVHCVTVPGAAACWTDCVKDFGRLPLADVLAPAIALAEEGVPIHAVAAQLWSDNAHQLLDRWGGLAQNPGAASLLVDGRPPRHGEVLRNPELAATLRTLAAKGAEGFYKGVVAEAIVKCVRAKGGVLSLEDLAAHATERVSPISTTFRGKVVHELPPNGSGLVALMALATLNELPPSGGPEDVLCQVEALRMAFAKGLADIGDGAPASADAYLSEARAVSAALENLGTDTTYLCCVDAAGNACSFICSNFEAFGSGLVPEGCGFSLQNRGRNFVLREGHPNCIGPGKRPYHTIIPGMVTDGGDFYAAFGVMGGFMQPQGHVQVLSNLLDRGMDPQASLDAPRWCIAPASGDLQDKRPDMLQVDRGSIVVNFEEGFPRDAVDFVELAGYRVVRGVAGHARKMFGRGQCVVASDCVRWAGSDGRGDGCAAGY